LPELSPEQSAALDQIRAQRARDPGMTLLLHGVTGSGKTEVYLRAATTRSPSSVRPSCWCRRST
jgi:primosomal protein N'